MYSKYVSFVIVGMVVTGAARSIVAKLFYQLGFEHPLFLTLLYLAGQALSLIPYIFWRFFHSQNESINDEDENQKDHLSISSHLARDIFTTTTATATEDRSVMSSRRVRFSSTEIAKVNDLSVDGFSAGRPAVNENEHTNSEDHSAMNSRRVSFSLSQTTKVNDLSVDEVSAGRQAVDENEHTNSEDHSAMNSRRVNFSSPKTTKANDLSVDEFSAGRPTVDENEHTNIGDDFVEHPSSNENTGKQKRTSSPPGNDRKPKLSKKQCWSVSTHGLPQQSRTENIVQLIPWYIKPAVPAFFNLLNSAMRWASLVFVAASVAEMLISGTELVLSVLATRLIRGRRVTSVRWVGVGVVTIGLCLVGVFDTVVNAKTESGDEVQKKVRDQIIGILLILGQSIMSVCQDIGEEVFMHEADFPPALLLGMEGAFGLIIALALYFPISPLLGENPSDVRNDLSNSKIIGLSIGWALLVTITGIFNIAATGVTSSMTRNVWKNCRTCLIWIVSVIIFYATGNPNLGEEWIVPGSFYTLIGFSVILAGIYVYYGKGSRA